MGIKVSNKWILIVCGLSLALITLWFIVPYQDLPEQLINKANTDSLSLPDRIAAAKDATQMLKQKDSEAQLAQVDLLLGKLYVKSGQYHTSLQHLETVLEKE